MQKNERYFLNGIIRYFKPSKILEVGIAQGGGSALILNAIKDLPGSHLISADYSEKYYGGNTDKLSGWLVEEKFSHLKNKWQVYRGGDISRFIETIGGDIDMLVLDTAHIHPWETLNFLCIQPFMKRDSWCVLHDVSLPMLYGRENDLACRYLYGHVVSDRKIMPVSDYESYFANIGAFHVINDTAKYINNLFESLLNPWAAMPEVFDNNIFPWTTPVLYNEDLEGIRTIINKYYPEYSKFFDESINFQNIITRHLIEKRKREHSFKSRFAALWKSNFPRSFSLAKRVKNFFSR